MDLFSYLLGKKAGLKKATKVIANPELVGTEENLTGLQVGNEKYKVSEVNANPTLAGTEADLTGLEVDGTKYKIDNLEHYSADEKVIGTWTDGKPLYQKTLTASTTASSTSTSLNLSTIPNLKEIHSIKGIVKRTDNNFTWCVPYYKTNRDFANFYYSLGQYGGFYFQSGDEAGYGHFEVTIQYTKTTD